MQRLTRPTAHGSADHERFPGAPLEAENGEENCARVGLNLDGGSGGPTKEEIKAASDAANPDPSPIDRAKYRDITHERLAETPTRETQEEEEERRFASTSTLGKCAGSTVTLIKNKRNAEDELALV